MTRKVNNGDPGAAPGTNATTGNTAFPDAFSGVTTAGAGTFTHDGGGYYKLLTAGGTDVARAYIEIAGADSWSFRGYFTPVALPQTSHTVFKWINVGFAGNGDIVLNSSSQLLIRNAAGVTLSTYATALTAGVEYRLECSVIKGTTTSDGTLNASLFVGESATPVHAYASGATVNSGTTQTLRAQLSENTAALTANMRWRSLIVDNATSALLGPTPFVMLRPAVVAP